MEVGLLNGIPFAVASIAMVLWGRRSDRVGERVWHTALPLALSALALDDEDDPTTFQGPPTTPSPAASAPSAASPRPLAASPAEACSPAGSPSPSAADSPSVAVDVRTTSRSPLASFGALGSVAQVAPGGAGFGSKHEQRSAVFA